MSKIKNDNYIQISGWMVKQLKLKGNELLIYAIIYGFCQDDSSSFRGGLAYFEEWLQLSKPTVIKALQSLIDKGLIQKITHEQNGITFHDYITTNVTFTDNLPEVPSKPKAPFKLGGTKKSDTRVRDLYALVNAFTENEEERKLLYRFIQNTLQLKRTLTVESFKLQLEAMRDLDFNTFQQVIENTITNGWINLKYELDKQSRSFNSLNSKPTPAVLELSNEQF